MATDWNNLTVVELRNELKRRGLAQSGKKAELVERLTTTDNNESGNQQLDQHPAENVNQENQEEQANQQQPEEQSTSNEIQNESPPAEVKKAVEGPTESSDVPPAESATESAAPQSEPEPQQLNPGTTEEEEEEEEEAPAPAAQASDPQETGNTKSPIPDQAPPAGDVNPDEQTDAPTQSSLKEDQANTEMTDAPAPVEPSDLPPAAAPDISSDARGRKRRSRSPPPSDDESSRKRTRPSDQYEKILVGDSEETNGIAERADEAVMPLDDDVAGKDISYAKLVDEVPAPHAEEQRADASPRDREGSVGAHDRDFHEDRDRDMERPEQERADSRGPAEDDYDRDRHREDERDRYSDRASDRMEEDDRDVAPAEHAATSALYIKNFMRPLKEPFLHDRLTELATPRGRTPNPDVVVEFYLDQIRTHAFVRFDSIASASRVRVALHGQVWPNERNRKELWVDFIPPEKVSEWSETEKEAGSGGRGSPNRWEVRYEPDDEGVITARLVNAAVEPPAPARQQASSAKSQPSGPSGGPIPSGPARQFQGFDGPPPTGPRGSRGGRSQAAALGVGEQTRAYPILYYQPVSEEVAQRRIDNMRSHYTQDRHRDMGREVEINRYTFENESQFVDRGKEVFVGIRPPHREAERRRGAGGVGGGRYGGGGGGPPPRAFPRAGDRYDGTSSRNDSGRDVPRSRFDGAPLPTFEASRPPRRRNRRGGGGGGGGFRGDRW